MSTLQRALRLAGLAAVALLAEPLAGLADTVAAGQLGVDEQASLALGASIATTATWIVTPVMFAQTTEIARLRAAGHSSLAARTTRSALVSAAAFGLVLGAILGGVAIFGGLSDDARDYLLARAVGLPVMALVMAGYGALRGSRAVHTVSALALSGAAVHIGLDVVVVQWTSLGLAGLGMASVASQLALAVFAIAALKRRGLLDAGPREATTSGSTWWQSASAVLVLSVRAAALGLAGVAMTSAAVGISPVAGAAHQVTYQFWVLTVLVVEGWKSAAQIMVSTAPTVAERLAVERMLLRFSAVLGVAAGAVMIGAQPLVDVFSADADVATVARSIWPLGALALAIGAVAFTRDGIEYGRASYVANLGRILSGTAVWVVGAWVTHVTGELSWMWWAMPVGLVVRGVVPFGLSRRKKPA